MSTLPAQVTEVLVWIGRFLKFVKMPGLVRAVRTRACRTLFTQMHLGAIHKVRELAIYMGDLSPNSCNDHVSGLARDVMTAFRDIMCDLLEVSDKELHCCFKVIVIGNDGKDRVVTFARSSPQDHRYDDNKVDCEHQVSTNSDWAALMGKDDGITRWTRPFSCFSCNDLPSRVSKYKCSRKDWSHSYNSTLAFPLRFLTQPAKNKYKTFGFVVFYSKRKNVFQGFPDIFEYVDQWDKYHTLLSENAAFQLGAALADMLSIALRPIYAQHELPKLLELESSNVPKPVFA